MYDVFGDQPEHADIESHSCRQIVQQDADSGKHPVAMTTLLERQLNECGA